VDFQFIITIVFLLVFMFGVYFFTRFIAGKASKTMKGRYIEHIEAINLTRDTRLHLIKVGAQFFLLSSSGKNAEIIREINIEDFDIEKDEKFSPFKFKNYIDNYLSRYRKKQKPQSIKEEPDIKKEKPAEVKRNAYDIDDVDGSNIAFRDNLSKLKDIIHRTNNESEN
jgi:flagellar protein FliO/FliZ